MQQRINNCIRRFKCCGITYLWPDFNGDSNKTVLRLRYRLVVTCTVLLWRNNFNWSEYRDSHLKKYTKQYKLISPRSIWRGLGRRQLQHSTVLKILYSLSRSGVFWVYYLGDIHVAVTRQTRRGHFNTKTLLPGYDFSYKDKTSHVSQIFKQVL